jgi:RecB family exonuclease
MLKLSVSSMDTYKTCPKKYHYRYIEKVDIETEPQIATAFGTCAHLILEIFHQNVDHDTPKELYGKIMAKSCKEAFASDEVDGGFLDQDVWYPEEVYKEQIERFLFQKTGKIPGGVFTNNKVNGIVYIRFIMQQYLDKIKKEGLPNVLYTEKDFSFEIKEGVTVRGFIDRIDKVSDTHYHVLDYKTSKNAKYLKDFQLLVYAKAIKLMYPQVKRITGSFMLLKHGYKEIEYELTDMEIGNCSNKILKSAKNILTEEKWIKKPGILCNWCDYKSICLDNWAEVDE